MSHPDVKYTLLGRLQETSFSSVFKQKLKFGRIAILTLVLFFVFISLYPTATHRKLVAYAHSKTSDPIPSIVHFVLLRSGDDAKIEFTFSALLSIFSTIFYIKPSKIHIHSDYNEAQIQQAARNGSIWTRKLLHTWPDLIEWNHVRVPNYAGPNDHQRIAAIQHKSDFVRWNTIAEIGGIYLDFDVILLKSLAPLQNAGFDFVAGRQYGGKDEDGAINGTINNGFFLTKPNSAMATIVKRDQHTSFNGEWASNLHTMTTTAEYLVTVPNQVLILDRTAFAPTHWFAESKISLFDPHEGPPAHEPIRTNSTDPIEIYDTVVQNRRSRRDWEMDFSSTYALHAFGTGQYGHRIHPRIILSRTSNYGVVTYDLVKAMVAQGIVNGTEDEKGEPPKQLKYVRASTLPGLDIENVENTEEEF